MSDEFRRLGKLLEPPWDEVRERRVLARIEEQWEAARRQRRDRRKPKRWLAWGAAAAALAGFGQLGAWFILKDRGAGPGQPVPGGGRRDIHAPKLSAASELSLGEGVRAYLAPDAEVAVLVRTSREVRVRQDAGKVRYVVRHRPGRRFVVEARGVIVEDLGTVFTVEVAGTVRVRVEEGAVRILGRGAWHRLDAGMELVVAPGGPGGPRQVRDAGAEAAREVPRGGSGGRGKGPAARGTARRSERQRPGGGTPRAGPDGRADIEALFKEVDAARRAGRLERAARLLRRIVASFPRDPRVVAALFTLGRVELARGRAAAAARAFRRCYGRSPRGPLAEDALAAAARAWARAGRVDRAHRAAARYLQRYPAGAHAGAMRRIVESRAKGAGKPDAAVRSAKTQQPGEKARR